MRSPLPTVKLNNNYTNMSRILLALVVGLALAATPAYHTSMGKMRRALQNEVSFEASAGDGIAPFDPSTIPEWDEMTPNEQAQVEEVYRQFEKLAHLMEDWATEFDADMAKFADDQPVPISDSARPDTGSRSENGWRLRRVRNLQDAPPIEGTTAKSSDPTNLQGGKEVGIHPDSYVPVGADPYPEDKPKKTIMDDPNAGPQNPDQPPPEDDGPKTVHESMLGFVVDAPPQQEKPAPKHTHTPPPPPPPAPAPQEDEHDQIDVLEPLGDPWAQFGRVPQRPVRVGHYPAPRPQNRIPPGGLILGGGRPTRGY